MPSTTTLASAPVPPVPTHSVLILLVQLCVLLLAARLLGSIALRVRLPRIVGELSAGILLGPSVLGHLGSVSSLLFPTTGEHQHLLDVVGQLGVLLLVGLAGAQLDIGYARRNTSTVAKVSGTGLLVPLLLGLGTGLTVALPLRPDDIEPAVFAAFIAVALSVSAIPVIAKTLLELGLMHRDIGQLVLAASAIDDAVGWLLLSIVAALAAHGVTGLSVVAAVGGLIGVLVVAVTIAGPLIRAAMRRADSAARQDSPTDTTGRVTVVMVIAILAGAVATGAVGFEPVLGAFLSGVLIRSSGVAAAHLGPLSTMVMTILAPIYFATAGLRMDLTALAEPVVLAAALAVTCAAIIGKFAGAYLGGWLSGLDLHSRVALGAGMNARGVIEVIIAMVGLQLGVLGTEAYTALVLVAVVTSIMAPPMLRWALGKVPESAGEAERARATASDPESVGSRVVGD
ncbi:cation:proton antiporter [Nocardia cyriacigeorgica]|uniref:cation:proton antiporter n=1 Tax=Nocardia cyriacigeorgica TaxID=135487 RepID=UPI0002DA983F|nr:cation:proton antiporter [Nocardia cyriacigeorgica]MBF6082361.1 cation:proton antiporter [Nocardia cyriacigeorgica]